MQAKYQNKQRNASAAQYQTGSNTVSPSLSGMEPPLTTPFGEYRYGSSPLRNVDNATSFPSGHPVMQKKSTGQTGNVAPVASDHGPVFEGGATWDMQAISPQADNTPGLVVQCVGGPKFGMEVTGDNANADVQAGLDLLRQKQAAYKLAIRTAKQTAITEFQGGDQADHARQATYTQALAAAEMTPEGLFARLDGGLTHAGDVISYNGVEIARVRRGNAAYVQHQAADAAAGIAAIYKRYTLNGPSGKEFVDVGGAKLRRYAYRGITPSERLAYKSNTPLRPLNHGVDAGRTGYNFNAATGAATERAHDLAAQPPKITDLEWLNQKAGTALPAVPANPALRAFLQTRKGAAKLLSATSTPRSIASNHGAAFTGFGNIQIDLARVPAANILHHYKQPEFDSAALNTAVGRGGQAPNGALTWETARANETVRRNRELVITEIPAAAVTALTDSPDRVAYEAEFRRLYDIQFTNGFTTTIADSDLDLAPMVTPAPANYPWVEDHFTLLQARTDFDAGVARAAGVAQAQLRIDFGNAYLASYSSAWTEKYEDAAWDSDHIADLQENTDANELGNITVNVPDAPDPGQIPLGMGQLAGAQAGYAAGAIAGAAAGANYDG